MSNTRDGIEKAEIAMSDAVRHLRDARRAIQNAIIALPGKEGVNTAIMHDMARALAQILERFDFWHTDTASICERCGLENVRLVRIITKDYFEVGYICESCVEAIIRPGTAFQVDVEEPIIVCLCGSTRFSEAFQEANFQETLAGRIVLTIGCDTKSDKGLSLSEATKVRLDLLHLRKIAKADEILVLNVNGYIGESTRNEIAYAQLCGKRIRYLESIEQSDKRELIEDVRSLFSSSDKE